MTEDDIDDLRIVCGYYGYSLLLNEKQKIVTSMEDVAYIQKDDIRGLFLVWRKNENVQEIKYLLRFTKEIIIHDLIPLDVKDFNKSFITNLTKLLGWKKGKTLNQLVHGHS